MIDDQSVRIGAEAFTLLQTQMDQQNFDLTVDDLDPEDIEEVIPFMAEALGHVHDHLSHRPEAVEAVAKRIFREFHYQTPWEQWGNRERFYELAVEVLDLGRS